MKYGVSLFDKSRYTKEDIQSIKSPTPQRSFIHSF